MSNQTRDNYDTTHNNRNLTAPSPSAPGTTEKDFDRNGDGYHLDDNMDRENALRRIQTSGSISISPELFEKIYLSPQNKVSGDLRKTFANPTPLALGGFLLALSPLSCDLMGWRGAGGNGAASTGVFFFFGGLLMILGSVGEFFLGNTFPFVVFGTYGAFWLAYGATLQPFYNAYGAYDPSDTAKGIDTPGFQSSFAFFLIFMAVLSFLFMILALRTNLIFFLIFLFLLAAFCLLAGAYWHLAEGDASNGPTHMIIAAGACTFVVDILGFWIFMAVMLAALDFPFQIPVFDLSHVVKGASDIAKRKKERQENNADYQA